MPACLLSGCFFFCSSDQQNLYTDLCFGLSENYRIVKKVYYNTFFLRGRLQTCYLGRSIRTSVPGRWWHSIQLPCQISCRIIEVHVQIVYTFLPQFVWFVACLSACWICHEQAGCRCMPGWDRAVSLNRLRTAACPRWRERQVDEVSFSWHCGHVESHTFLSTTRLTEVRWRYLHVHECCAGHGLSMTGYHPPAEMRFSAIFRACQLNHRFFMLFMEAHFSVDAKNTPSCDNAERALEK